MEALPGLTRVGAAQAGDAAVCLASRSAVRELKTFKAGGFVDFNTTNITPSGFGFGCFRIYDQVATIGYIRGESAYKKDGLKLGDIFIPIPSTSVFPLPTTMLRDLPVFALPPR